MRVLNVSSQSGDEKFSIGRVHCIYFNSSFILLPIVKKELQPDASSFRLPAAYKIQAVAANHKV